MKVRNKDTKISRIEEENYVLTEEEEKVKNIFDKITGEVHDETMNYVLKDNEVEDKCTICLEYGSDENRLLTLHDPEGANPHRYHYKCITNWWKRKSQMVSKKTYSPGSIIDLL